MPLKSVGVEPKDRVRTNTPERVNEKIDNITDNNIEYYSRQKTSVIKARIKELDKEWDVERALMLNAAVIGVAGLLLGAFRNRNWLILPGVVSAFLAQHAIQGWCPPLAIFRKLGIRTQKEIERERYALIRAMEKKIAHHN